MGSYLTDYLVSMKQYTPRGWDDYPALDVEVFPPTLRRPLVQRLCHLDNNADAPTIVIPAVHNGREGCHYQSHCYKSYSSNVPIWDVFDRETTLRLLGEFGICVVEPKNGGYNFDIVPLLPALLWPMPTSQLSHMAYDGSLPPLGNGEWSLGEVKQCCTKLIPDSTEHADLLRKINFAFGASLLMRESALRVHHAALVEAGPLANYVALHWRNDEDFTKTDHKLNSTAYIIAASDALQAMRTTMAISSDAPLHVVVLGDLNMTALKAIETAVNKASASLEPAGGNGRFLFHSKVSLVPDMNLTNTFPSEDVRGQVDFEIGVKAPAFLGSPFSSFSVLIAFKRSYRSYQHTAMIDADIATQMGVVFKLQFPYDLDMSDNPCSDMLEVFDGVRLELLGCSRKASSSCPELAPGFAFEPAMDDPRRIEGHMCDDAVGFTVLLGTNDSLQVPDDTSVPHGRTCWFAFMNAEAADAIGVKAGAPFGPLPMYSMWNIIVLDDAQLPFGPDPSENSRNSQALKMLGHRAFRIGRVMVYLDNKLKILSQGKLGEFVVANLISPRAAWVSPHHPQRLSAYTEAQCTPKLGLVDDRALEQMTMYRSKSFPSAPAQRGGPGLIEGEWHLRDLSRPESAMIGCEWFREFEYWGHRHDQLSFNYVVWSLFANATTNDAVPSNPAFLYPTHNAATWYSKSHNSSSIICDPDTGI
jgi:hypothetical protein